MGVNAQPQQELQALQQGDQTKITAYQALNSALQSVSTDSVLMSLPTDWQATAATTSDATIATATSTSAAVGGAFTFSVQNLVNDINSVINQAKSAVSYDPTNAANSGPLLGDSTVEGLASGTQAVTGGISGSTLGDASALGITVNAGGTLAFDQTKFQSALAANPQGVADLFQRTAGNGIAQQVKAFADGMSDPTKGAITAAIQGNQASITDLTGEINAWQPILDMERTPLTTEFTQMEMALSQLNSQKAALGL
jgi:flagellar hook-associated protein 2